jgi:hypothetical protein
MSSVPIELSFRQIIASHREQLQSMSEPSLVVKQLRRDQLHINEAAPEESEAMLTYIIER